MKHIVVGTAGHIDHGKSALVQALTGVDPDRLKEEKTRGITIDLGFAHYQHAGLNVAFVDVPGHERFVRNMLAGASGIDCVLLVVAADESVMPQTREHFDICRLLGVEAGLIALTKRDLVDDETLALVRLETHELVAGSFLEGAPVVPVSAQSGAGLEALRDAMQGVAARVTEHRKAGVARLPIDRAFTVKGFGTVVTGTLVSGEISVDCDLELLPAGRRAKVRGLQVHGEAQGAARGGQRVAVNLAGVEVGEFERGDTLVAPGGLETTRCFDATLTLLPNARSLKHGARVRCHQGTTEVMARVALATLVDADGHAPGPEAPQGGFLTVLAPGADAYVRVRLERPAALTRGDRFVLRAYSPTVTIAGGTVLDPSPPRGRLRSLDGAVRLGRLANRAEPREGVTVMVEEAGARGLARAVVARRAGVAPVDVAPLVESLVADGRALPVGDLLVAPGHLGALREQLIASVAEFHAAHPLEAGVPREATRERFSHRTAHEVFDHVIRELVADGTLVATDRLALASHEIELSAEESSVRAQVERIFRDAALTPPEPASVAGTTGAGPDVVDRMLKLLLRDGTLVKVEALVFHTEALERLKRDVAGLKGPASTPVQIDVGGFKDRFRISRKYAIPLLGYLDRERVTRRVGKARVVL